jgi:glycosyltransferase involved in cell wall biosynthesis
MTRVASFIAKAPGPPPAHSNGAIIAGDIDGQNGIAASGRMLGAALAARGLLRGTMPLGLPSVAPDYTGTPAPGAAIIAVVNAPYLPVGLSRLKPRDMLRSRRMIGVWVWELPRVPADWAIGARFVHEIWAPTRFTAEAFETIAPGRVRLVPYPLLTELPFTVTGSRESFNLPADVFIVLTIFNLSSSCARKNPLGAIAAFKAAFGSSRDALLVLKLTGQERYEGDFNAIRAAIGDAPNIRIITETLSEPSLRGLMTASDVVLSLHRAEGFGLIPATAALLGIPVVATAYSGNLDFMSPDSSGLVQYRLVPVSGPDSIYKIPGAEWAEPDIGDAAAWLRRLFDDPALRSRLGAAGQLHALQALSLDHLDAALAANGIT